MKVQSYDEFDVLGEFLPNQNSFVQMSRSDAGSLVDEPLGGHFSWLGDQLGVLYRWDDRLRIRLGELDLGLGDTNVEWTAIEETRRLSVGSNFGALVADYDVASTFDFDFTAGAEAEHFDFGLFVFNVANDSERAARFSRAV